MHAHVDVETPVADLRSLGSVIFAATRSLAEARQGLKRRDELVVWGVGSHPARTASHDSFDPSAFRSLIKQSAFVSEFGLDGAAKVSMDRQLRTLRAAFDVLTDQPRIVSLHSYRATDLLVNELTERPVRGVVLHWWLGSAAATKRAADLGSYFSVNAAMFRRSGHLRHIPLERMLTETDHPFGDRSSPEPRAPGNVLPVEYAIARLHGLQPEQVRGLMWANLNRLVRDTGCMSMLGRSIRLTLEAVVSDHNRIR